GDRGGETGPRADGQAGHRRRQQRHRPDAGGAARLAAGHLRLQGRDRRVEGQGDPRGRRRPADDRGRPAGDRHRGPAPQRAALRLAAQHHEGQEEAARREERRQLRRRHRAAPDSAQSDRAPQASGRDQGRDRRRAGGQAEERSGGPLMAVLVIADHDNAHVRDTTNKTVTAALALSSDVDVLVAGKGADAAAAQAARIAGVRKVLQAESDELNEGMAEAFQALIVPLMASYDAVLTPATSQGKNIAPRIAAALDVSQISEIIEVVDGSTFVRPIYAGNALETVKTSDAKKVITVRTSLFKAAGEGGSASVEKIAAPGAPEHTHFVGQEVVKSDRPELAGAKIVVSGGRAMGSAEEFQRVIDPLADKLGAAVGASRAAVDAGY